MGNQEDNNIENKESKILSVKTAGLLLAGLLIVLVIVILSVKSCTISKEVETDVSNKNQDEVVLVQDSLSSEKESNNSENENYSDESIENPSSDVGNSEGNGSEISEKENIESDSEKVETDNSSNSDSSSSNALFEVDEPMLGESKEVSVIVSSKDVYVVDGKYYTYSIGLIMLEGEGYDIVKYFCPKKSYDAVESGESLNATYQLDENGLVSITSISK